MKRFRRLPTLLLHVLLGTANLTYGGEADIPSAAPNCALAQPPESAGAYVVPGGFLLVYPRNAQLPKNYTGCKSIWVADSFDHTPLLMTSYFEQGRLRIVRAFEGRGETELRAACVLPSRAEACRDVESNPLAALYLPTWPRICMTKPELPVCGKEPD